MADVPTVEELSTLESARERARRAKEAAVAAAHAAGITIPPPPTTQALPTTAEFCGASSAAYTMALIATVEGLPDAYATYYFGLAEAYGLACAAG